MSNVHFHPPHPGNDISERRKVIRACIAPACWISLGVVSCLFETPASKMIGFFMMFAGLVTLVYNLLRINRRKAEKKDSLHL